MEPLIILVGAFLAIILVIRLVSKKWLPGLAGRLAVSGLLIFTGVAHFIYTDGMVLMLPPFVPFKTALIYATGVIEIAAAVGLLIPRFQKLTAWLLILFLVLILPSNIYAAYQHVNIRTASFDGPGPFYLWFRIPLQLFFIAWVYYFGIRLSNRQLAISNWQQAISNRQ